MSLTMPPIPTKIGQMILTDSVERRPWYWSRKLVAKRIIRIGMMLWWPHWHTPPFSWFIVCKSLKFLKSFLFLSTSMGELYHDWQIDFDSDTIRQERVQGSMVLMAQSWCAKGFEVVLTFQSIQSFIHKSNFIPSSTPAPHQPPHHPRSHTPPLYGAVIFLSIFYFAAILF